MDWSKMEVDLIVQEYFEMLQKELNREKYNKTFHRNRILPKLNERSEGAIEFKNQNISAALINMGLPFITGYKPLFNYQKELLEKEISDYIIRHKIELEKQFETFSSSTSANSESQSNIDFENILSSEPVISEFKEPEPLYKPTKINYLEKEQNNRQLGEEGEKLIMEYEKWRLMKAGKNNLVDKIEWISKDLGDGAGFDILSKNNNGTDRYIEVKTTKLTKETPIYLSRNEWRFAQDKEQEFFLYRIFNFAESPQIFIKQGQYENFCKLQPQSYKGYFL